ncbi:MAG: HD domain-containing protein [Anaerolineae bacterium]|nr:HD domain-containing protein [Anaerolineae bacterium]MCB9133079.1 HD domain-containing protein [Anaerolineales bacterium]MCB0232354.1 HD domain-containing protein [Anaerolineae bacterium]MCB0236720.1 HD domain-containing protein [Anaerolineae bacterium]MCB0239105.1 HD domain-containing protein [Anaerolineae bacterium]
MITIDQARVLYNGADAAHSFDHILRVLALAEHIAAAEGADVEIVRTATLLHDIARVEPDHQLLGAQRAREILAGQPAERVDAVCHAIEAHRFRKGPQPATIEACCLFDADKLDAIGAVGVARSIAYGAIHGQRIWSQSLESIDASQPPPGEDNYTPSHEFVYKLTRLADMLKTATARRIAADRHQVMVEFFHRLDLEVAGDA